MTILECKRHFKSELVDLYSEAEIAKLYSIFLYHQVGFDTFQQRKFSHQELLISDEEDLVEILKKLKSGKPYQQILGYTEFYKLRFSVDENVLIPRPETEELLEITINKIRDSRHETRDFKIIDIGTGSGIIPITLKKNFPKADVSAMDISEKALEIAQKNAVFHKTEIRFFQADYLNTDLTENYDIIISNPPYIGIDENAEIEDSVKGFEPNIALFSPTQDALIFYRKIAKDCEKHLNENGQFFLEINQKLGNETLELFKNFSESELVKDLSGNDRFIIGRK
ncbi:peptide chain release factor N(5)-glutamine methyltransferase [Cloacibacterium sp. TD35]|uniref:peptide chain release factor N(5)-glutamine methyltransferase n=1 Tax=Cloacibacterium sp. TD35 TaxID=2976818 RepID=UPI00237E4260|nr:peptide chain release factor N(5)-glutamine methyltransferase [Cloacibacterium sp. TD35]WDT67299.1 peptide chain release factor N(5)-glutamine methyltransferase [Cloacibacterium sp. TD35]